MFRQKAQKNLSLIPITPPEDRHAPKESRILDEQPRQLPQQVPRQLSLLERRQLRQQQMGLQVQSLSQPESSQSLGISKITPVISPGDLSAVYMVDKSKTLGEESQFKVAYKATKKGDNKNYVIFVFKKMTGSEGESDKESKEIKIFEKLIKENRCETHAICPVQVGIFEGAVAIVTEFIEGITLAKLIEILKERDEEEYRKNGLTIPLVGGYKLGYLYALQLFEKIIRSLQFIHDTWHFVHLDLKPDNIMISNDGSSVYIIDLGSGCFSPEFVQENCDDRFAAEGFVAPESVYPDEGYWDLNKNSTPEQNRKQFENWKKADIYSIGKVFSYFLMQEVVSFGCDKQKEELIGLINNMIDDEYIKRPDSARVFSDLLNLKSIQCAGSIAQLARCFM